MGDYAYSDEDLFEPVERTLKARQAAARFASGAYDDSEEAEADARKVAYLCGTEQGRKAGTMCAKFGGDFEDGFIDGLLRELEESFDERTD